MSNNELVVKFSIDNRNFTMGIDTSQEALRRFQSAVTTSNAKMAEAEARTRSWGRKLRDSVIVLGLARNAILNLDAALLSLPRSVIRANAEFERMNMLMQGLSTETGNLQDVIDQANRDQAFVIDTALTAPFDIQSIQDSFVKMRTVGIDPTAGAMQGLIDSVAKFGGTPEQLKRASIAIQQMGGKGTISMEELRQQLGEAVPDAIKLMSRGVGLSMGELVDKISTGTVESTEALKALFRQMEIENSGSALKMSQTWDGTMARLQTRIQLFYKEIGDAGAFENLKAALTQLTDEVLVSPEAISAAKSLGDAMGTLVQAGVDFANFVFNNSDAVKTLLGGALIFLVANSERAQRSFDKMTFTSGRLITALRATSRGWMEAAAGANAYAASAGRAQAAAGAAALAASRNATLLSRSVGALTLGVKGLGSSLMAFMGGPWGVFIAGLYAAYEIYQAFSDKTLETVEGINFASAAAVSREEIEALEKTIDAYDEAQKKVRESRQKMEEADAFRKNAAARAYGNALRELNEIKRVLPENKDIEQLKAFADEVNRTSDNLLRNQIKRAVETKVAGDLRILVEDYKGRVEAITNDVNNANRVVDKARLDEQELSRRQAYFEQEIAQFKEARRKELSFGDAANREEIKRFNIKINALTELRRQYTAALRNEDVGGISESEKAAQKAQAAYETYFKQISVRLEQFKAKYKGASTEVAKFNELVAQGKFGDLAQEDIETARKVAQGIDTWKAKIKANEEAADRYDKALRKIDQTVRVINDKFAKIENQNPFMDNLLVAEKYKERLVAIREELESLGERKYSQDIDRINQELEGLYGKAGDATIAEIVASTEDLTDALMSDADRINAEYDKIVDNLKELRNNTDLAFGPEAKQKIDAYFYALDAKRLRDLETPIQGLARQWSDTTSTMNQVWADTMQDATSAITDFVMTGKFNFQDLLQSFARMVVQMQIQAAAANLIGAFSGGANVFATTFANQSAGKAGAGANAVATSAFADGGIMTSEGAVALKKYAKGGIANTPQLALFGEGSQPEAYVPLPDGRTIPVTVNSESQPSAPGNVNMQVNVINESGQPVEAEQQGSPRFDGDKFILDVVMRGMNRPGEFRDNMRNSVR